jgi:hypothetical protein
LWLSPSAEAKTSPMSSMPEMRRRPSATDRVRTALAGFGPAAHFLQSQTQGLVDELFQTRITAFPQPFERRGDVVIEGQGRTYAQDIKAFVS